MNTILVCGGEKQYGRKLSIHQREYTSDTKGLSNILCHLSTTDRLYQLEYKQSWLEPCDILAQSLIMFGYKSAYMLRLMYPSMRDRGHAFHAGHRAWCSF
jgi:hypothetical protein